MCHHARAFSCVQRPVRRNVGKLRIELERRRKSIRGILFETLHENRVELLRNGKLRHL